MTDPQEPNLEELKELMSKSTERPWVSGVSESGRPAIGSPKAETIAVVSYTDDSFDEYNAALIVASVNELPNLIGKIERQQSQLLDAYARAMEREGERVDEAADRIEELVANVFQEPLKGFAGGELTPKGDIQVRQALSAIQKMTKPGDGD